MPKIRKNLRYTSELSIASMSDIAFLLIIFFIVTSSFIVHEGLKISLPDKHNQVKKVSSSSVYEISIIDATTLKIGKNRQIKTDELANDLKNIKESKSISFLLLKIPEKTDYSIVINILDIIKSSSSNKTLSLEMVKN